MAEYVTFIKVGEEISLWMGEMEEGRFRQDFYSKFSSFEEAVLNVKKKVKEYNENEENVRVYISLPASFFLYRFLKLPKTAAKKIEKIINFEMEKEIPLDVETLDLKYFVLKEEEGSVYLGVFAITNGKVKEIAEIFRQSGFYIDAIVPEPFLLYAITIERPAIVIKQEKGNSYIMVSTSQCLEIYNFAGDDFKSLVSVAEVVLKSVESRWGAKPEKGIWIGDLKAEGKVDAVEFESIRNDIAFLEGWKRVIVKEVEPPQFAKEEYMSPARTAKWKGFYTAGGILVVVLLMLTLITDFMEYSRYKNAYFTEKKRIESIFRATFPDVKNIVDPVLQMKERLNKLKLEEREGTNKVIDLLLLIGDEIKSRSGMKVEKLIYDGSGLKVEGIASSATDIDSFQRALEKKKFKKVTILNTKKTPKGEYEFKISVKIL